MAIVSYFDYDNASEEARNEFDKQMQQNGLVTNMKKTLLHSVKAYRAYQEWYSLRDELIPIIGQRCVIIFSFAISSENECLLCSTYFRKAISDLGENPDSFKLSSKEKILKNYGTQLVRDANNISGDIYKKLKESFSDEEIVKLTAFAGIMIATNIFNSALQINLDDYLNKLRY
jgi:hypothetical protein